MKLMFIRTLTTLIALLFGNSLLGKELIKSYHTDIQISETGRLHVTETIVVNAEGIDIKRGITRDFPLEEIGGRKTTFEVTGVKRDGADEPYHTNPTGSGIQLKVGSANKFLEVGVYTYEISFITDFHIRYHKHHDELNFNVIPHGRMFPILDAQVSITLPEAFHDVPVYLDAYSGKIGEYGDNFEMLFQDRTIQLRSTSKLQADEGITVEAIWQTGPIPRPADFEIFNLTADPDGFPDFDDRLIAVITVLMAVFALGAFIQNGGLQRVVIDVGRSTPPGDVSPAFCRYLMEDGTYKGCLSAGIMSLGIKGFLKIKRTVDDDDQSSSPFKVIKLENQTPPSTLSEDEQVLLERLFSEADELEFSKDNRGILVDLDYSFAEKLRKESEGCLHPANLGGKLFTIGITGALLVLASPYIFGDADIPESQYGKWTDIMLLMIVMTACLLGYVLLYLLTHVIYFSVKTVLVRLLTNRPSQPAFEFRFSLGCCGALGICLFLFNRQTLGILGNLYAVFGDFLRNEPYLTTALMLSQFILMAIDQSRPNPTVRGAELKGQILGFRDWLSAKTAYQLESAENRLALFEKWMPYAVALNVGNDWAHEFESDIKLALSIDNTELGVSRVEFYNWAYQSDSDLQSSERSSDWDSYQFEIESDVSDAVYSSSSSGGWGGGGSGGGGGGSGGGGGGSGGGSGGGGVGGW